MLLSIFAIYKGHDLKSDPNRGTKTGRVASEFNTLANICFTRQNHYNVGGDGAHTKNKRGLRRTPFARLRLTLALPRP
ncbi:unnamed protein product, partial [Brassica oleracea]